MKFDNNQIISILGTEYTIVFEKRRSVKDIVHMDEDLQEIRVYRSELSSKKHSMIFYNWLVNFARKVISKRTEEISRLYGFNYNRIAIKNTKTRWGSCSSKRNLNFNWRLLLLEPVQMDYVIIHELAHLKQMNHSQKFWALVNEMMPNYKSIQRELKEVVIE